METNTSSGRLFIIATPIGNLEDISFRALKILSIVDLVACEDTRITRILLQHYGISKPLVSYHSHNEVQRAHELVEMMLQGKTVALVSDAGTPGISDPAMVLVRSALRQGIAVIPIPGPSAFLTAIVASGISCKQFVFEGFLPKKKGRKTVLENLKNEKRTIIIYESPYRIIKTLKELYEHFGNREITVCRELTKKFEEICHGTFEEVLNTLESKPTRGEYVLVIAGKNM